MHVCVNDDDWILGTLRSLVKLLFSLLSCCVTSFSCVGSRPRQQTHRLTNFLIIYHNISFFSMLFALIYRVRELNVICRIQVQCKYHLCETVSVCYYCCCCSLSEIVRLILIETAVNSSHLTWTGITWEFLRLDPYSRVLSTCNTTISALWLLCGVLTGNNKQKCSLDIENTFLCRILLILVYLISLSHFFCWCGT